MHKNDINAPKLALKSQFDLKAYSCDIIANKSKKLDRLALIEITKALLLTESSSSQKCCAACCDLTRNSTVYLAKYFTFEDLKCVRFNFDFGLGVFTGLEMITLPQGEIIRNDLIQRLDLFYYYFYNKIKRNVKKILIELLIEFSLFIIRKRI